MSNIILEYWKKEIGELQESEGRKSIGDSVVIGRISIVTASEDKVKDRARTMIEKAEKVLEKEAA